MRTVSTVENSTVPTERQAEADPRFALMDHAMGYLFPAALRAAAALGVADHLRTGPRPVTDLAERVGADPLNLYRTLRLLATRGIFTEDDTGRFALTPAAELLRTDVPGSFRSAVLMLTDRTFWRTAGELEEAVRTGKSPFERLFGMPFFDHFARDADTAAVFHVGRQRPRSRQGHRPAHDELAHRPGAHARRVRGPVRPSRVAPDPGDPHRHAVVDRRGRPRRLTPADVEARGLRGACPVRGRRPRPVRGASG